MKFVMISSTTPQPRPPLPRKAHPSATFSDRKAVANKTDIQEASKARKGFAMFMFFFFVVYQSTSTNSLRMEQTLRNGILCWFEKNT